MSKVQVQNPEPIEQMVHRRNPNSKFRQISCANGLIDSDEGGTARGFKRIVCSDVDVEGGWSAQRSQQQFGSSLLTILRWRDDQELPVHHVHRRLHRMLVGVMRRDPEPWWQPSHVAYLRQIRFQL